ncbi:MAG TPA: aspartate--tRNA ligase [Actinomycetota bacterium]|nr:aspartate--tRNA ligase [Actinomycetota bacterium]
MKRTHYCGDVRASDSGKTIELRGWVHKRRDHGGVIFIDLRDRQGLIQLVIHPDKQPDAYAMAEKLRSEFVVRVSGAVKSRLKDAVNPNLETGEVEIDVAEIEILSTSETPPFAIDDRAGVNEETRLRYRYLDLRRPEMVRVLRLRHQTISAIREFFDAEGFLEVETPLLTKPTPEGAHDFLVPTRLHPGKFLALPQSPQLFKQLLMIGGVDRYYQIARCFRDEDPRADRHQDFTQLDMEMSFVTQEDVLDVGERMFKHVWKTTLGVDLEPFERIRYQDAMDRFGSDRPDLRFGVEIADVSNVFSGTQVQVFRSALDKGGVAKAIAVPSGAGRSRKEIESLVAIGRSFGAGGVAWIALRSEGIASPLEKFLTEEEILGVREATGAGEGDLLLIVCDKPSVAAPALGGIRLAVADQLGLRAETEPTDPAHWKFAWILDFPLVEWSEQEERWDAVHHPFTAPRPEDEDLLVTDPGKVRAQQYDLMVNGWELGGGSIRIHSGELQKRIFDLIGLDEDTISRRFGWFLDAFKYGVPPHGGIAPGIDRIVAKLAGKETIRDVIAFPKTGSYLDALTGAPYEVDEEQLQALHLEVVHPDEE